MSKTPGIGYVGVINGEPIFRRVSDSRGDCTELVVFEEREDAHARYFNVRRVHLVLDPEVLSPPEDWGATDE